MHDPMTLIYGGRWLEIWHVDPERDGSDDSCGWFMRSRHGDQGTLSAIARDFAFEWSSGVPRGWFDADGDPNYSPQAITLGMFRIAANHVFGHWSRRGDRFLRRYLFNILHFAENSCDSLYTFITRPWGKDDRETPDARAMEAARIVYPWILRAKRPWWRHPRWHVWHWSVRVRPLAKFKRWLFTRCAHCGKGFGWGECPVSGNWDSDGPRWFRGELGVFHHGCHRVMYVGADPASCYREPEPMPRSAGDPGPATAPDGGP